MMYQYYEKIALNEHYYFVEELHQAFGALLPNHVKPKDIHYIIKNYLKKENLSVRVLYHQTSKGLKRVYPIELAFDAITNYVSSINNKIKEANNESRSTY